MAELKRECYETLKTWKASKGKECLLVKGARQIGKTFIIEKFGSGQRLCGFPPFRGGATHAGEVADGVRGRHPQICRSA